MFFTMFYLVRESFDFPIQLLFIIYFSENRIGWRLEIYQRSIPMDNVWYNSFIGDGDSSAMQRPTKADPAVQWYSYGIKNVSNM